MSPDYQPGLVSVIIPTYNRAILIAETLNSVLKQTYRRIELLIVDDGSTDNTKEIIENCLSAHNKKGIFEVRLLHQGNRGASAARNLGLIESRGQFVQFLDSDDLIAPSKIERQVENFKCCSDKTAVYGSWRFFQLADDGIDVYGVRCPCEEAEPLKKWITEDLENWFVASHSFLWKRTDLIELGPWDESLYADQDGDYAMRFMMRGGQLAFCLGAWAYYRLYPDTADSIRADDSFRALGSRYRVICRIEDELTSKQMLEPYSLALSIRYAELARRSALYHKDLAELCLIRSRRLSPDGKLPVKFNHQFISKIIGLSAKHRLGWMIRKTFGIPIKGSSKTRDIPIAHVSDIEKVRTFDDNEGGP
jgi:glycosyltransferase involved in cell wall biosynthesis